LLVAIVKYFYGLSRLNRLLLFMILGRYNNRIRRRCNPIIDLSKFASNKKKLNDVRLLKVILV